MAAKKEIVKAGFDRVEINNTYIYCGWLLYSDNSVEERAFDTQTECAFWLETMTGCAIMDIDFDEEMIH